MQSGDKLTINIIYTPGTVSILKSFFASLHWYSNCHFRLVANGCSDQECDELALLAHTLDRLSWYRYPSEKMVFHHECLNHLVSLDPDERFFAFFDSDILAVAPFAHELISALGESDGVFSGAPIWLGADKTIMPRKFKIMGGRFLRLHTGFLLGYSYCAIYRRQNLVEFMKETGIGFERYKWDQIPPTYQYILQSLDCKKAFYDTGKLLNILMQQRGNSFTFSEGSGLMHMGGHSIYSLPNSRLKAEAHTSFGIQLPFLGRVVKRQVANLKSGLYLTYDESRDIEICNSLMEFTSRGLMTFLHSPNQIHLTDPLSEKMKKLMQTLHVLKPNDYRK